MKTTTLCLSALLLFPACERKLPDVDPAGASVAAGAPILAMELELDGPQFRDHEDGHDDEDPADALPIGSDSPAACMAWTTRKKAKIESWMPRYVECVLKKGLRPGLSVRQWKARPTITTCRSRKPGSRGSTATSSGSAVG